MPTQDLIKECTVMQAELDVLRASLIMQGAPVTPELEAKLRKLREREARVIATILFCKLEELFPDINERECIARAWREIERVLPLDEPRDNRVLPIG